MSSIDLGSVRTIAKKDFQDAVRSWLFMGLSVLFFVLIAGLTALVSYVEADALTGHDAATEALVFQASQTTRLIIPLIALILGWKAIAGERESGSIKVLLSLPHSRKDVILGKLLGRSAVLSFSLVIGFVLAAVVVVALIGSFDVVDYVVLLAMSVLYALAYTSIAVSVSSLTRSTTLAGGAMFGIFALFYVVWNALLVGLGLLLDRGTISGVEYTQAVELPNGTTQQVTGTRLPDWALFVDMVDPGNAYQNAITFLGSTGGDGLGTYYPEAWFPGGDVPFYLQDWFSFVVLLAWIVVPVAIALYRFDRVDL